MYQVLYRKYRPKVFADVCGQDHVTSTLKNEIKENRIAHAYLFTGSRGTGKTTCAKILAKAVNCENRHDGEPCNACEVCTGLDSGAIYDVVEIDAASNNGVDNIRDLREEANYTPTRGRYRVYIIDEVHMLSTGAFNALLKTLEEPPAHVIFILATTEVHKLPATILSRCQRFDFKRIQPETMAVRLKQVAQAENMSLDDDAAVLIARLADGALRDGLSILDQCAGTSAHIDSKLVSEIAGLAGREMLYQLSDCICNRDSSQAIDIVSQLYQNSYDMERLCTEMINHFRNFLVVKTVKKSRGLVICSDSEFESIVKCAADFSLESIIYALDLFQNTLAKIKTGASARIEMEMTFIKLCEPGLDTCSDAILDRLSKLERKVQGYAAPQAKTKESAGFADRQGVSAENAPENKKSANTNHESEDAADIRTALSDNPNPHEDEQRTGHMSTLQSDGSQDEKTGERREFEQWAEFMDMIYASDIALFGVLNGAKGFIKDEFFLIDSPNPTVREFIKIPTHAKAIKQALFDVTGIHYKLGLYKQKNASRQPKRDLLEDLINQAQNNVKINFE